MKKIRVGLCGFGFIGKMHSLAYKTMNISTASAGITPELRALCSQSTKENEDYLYVTDDFEKLVKDEELDLIDICTPDFMHFDQGMKAMQKKKHVYIEKPIGQNIDQSKKMAQFAQSQGLINQTALVMRFQPKVVAARDFIRNGSMGEIINFKGKIFNNAYIDPNRLVNWRLRKEMSAGGSLMDTGVHIVDLTRFLLGDINSVRCKTSIFFKERFTDEKHSNSMEMNNDEWSFMEVELANGIKGEIETTRIAAGLQNRNYFEIFGTKAYLYIDLLSTGYLKIYNRELGKEIIGPIPPESDFAKHLSIIHPAPMFDMGVMVNTHSASAMNILINIKAGKTVHPETPTLMEAYQSQMVVEMGYRSAREQSRIVRRDEMD